MIGDAGAREPAKDGRPIRLQARIAPHPEGRAGGEREQVREEVARGVHEVDGRAAVGHRHVDVHAEDEQRACELLELFDDVLVPLAGGDDLIDPVREGVRAGRGHGEARAIGGCAELAAHPQHFALELQHVRANGRAQFDDGLMHFPLDLIAQRQGARGEQLAHVGTKRPGGGVDDLELFFDANGEPMRHAVPPVACSLQGHTA